MKSIVMTRHERVEKLTDIIARGGYSSIYATVNLLTDEQIDDELAVFEEIEEEATEIDE